MPSEISLNEDDEEELKELVSDYISDSPKSRTDALVRKFRFMDMEELSSMSSLEDFSYYCVTRMNRSGEIRNLLEYLIKKDSSSSNRHDYSDLIEKYSTKRAKKSGIRFRSPYPRSLDDSVRSKTNSKQKNTHVKKWDVFISHASGDKEKIASPLANELRKIGLEVWYDKFTLKWGDSLMHSIDEGLKNSLFGIVILSKNFFAKEWTKKELGGLMNLASRTSEKKILPLRYGLTPEQVSDYSPLLSDILSRSWDEGLENLSAEIKDIVEEKKGKQILKKSLKEKIITKDSTERKFIKNHYLVPPEPYMKILLNKTDYFTGNDIIARIAFLGINKGETIAIETYDPSHKVIDLKRIMAPSNKGYFDIKLFRKTNLEDTGEYSVVASTQFGPSGTTSFVYRTSRIL